MKIGFHSAIALLLVAGCAYSSRTAWLSSSSVRLQRDGDCVAVAAYRGGELRGAEAAIGMDFAFAQWIEPGDRVVDHPELAMWRADLEGLRAATRAADTDPRDVAAIARRVPFADAVVDVLEPWVEADIQRIAAVLDGVGEIQLTDDFALELAVAARRSGFDADRIAGWVTRSIESGHDTAALVLIEHPNAGTEAAIAALSDLDDVASEHRRAMFDRAAVMLLGDESHATLILEALEELPHSAEADALFALLDHAPAVPNEFLAQATRDLDSRPSASRRELLRRILDAAPDVAALDARDIADALETLRSGDRLDGARKLFEQPTARPEQVVVIVDRIHDLLPSRDREPALLEVLASRFGSDRAVWQACERAAMELSTKRRERVLAKLRELEQPAFR